MNVEIAVANFVGNVKVVVYTKGSKGAIIYVKDGKKIRR
jgi:sugar/nucleoside kinase (ribokinase family)